MSETKSESKVPSARQESTSGATTATKGSQNLVTETGRTSIADSVVAKITGMAAREVGGVYRMGGGTARAIGAVRERIPGSGGGGGTATRGVAVEVGERQAAVDIDLVVEYGVSIPDLAAAVRRNVINSVERMTGLETTEVNISIDDVHLPDEGESSEEESGGSGGESRVQ